MGARDVAARWADGRLRHSDPAPEVRDHVLVLVLRADLADVAPPGDVDRVRRRAVRRGAARIEDGERVVATGRLRLLHRRTPRPPRSNRCASPPAGFGARSWDSVRRPAAPTRAHLALGRNRRSVAHPHGGERWRAPRPSTAMTREARDLHDLCRSGVDRPSCPVFGLACARAHAHAWKCSRRR